MVGKCGPMDSYEICIFCSFSGISEFQLGSVSPSTLPGGEAMVFGGVGC